MFATLNDLKRILRININDNTNDAELTAALEAANDLVGRTVHVRYLPGPQVKTYFHVAGDARIDLPAEEVVITSIVAADGWELSPDQYHVQDGSVRFTSNYGGMGITEFRRFRYFHPKLTITYTSADEVPAGLREATALLAADFYPVPIEDQGNVISEKLGDYQYTLSAKDEGGVPYRRARARDLLAPYIHGGGAFVV